MKTLFLPYTPRVGHQSLPATEGLWQSVPVAATADAAPSPASFNRLFYLLDMVAVI
jgi:hypothetical protein